MSQGGEENEFISCEERKIGIRVVVWSESGADPARTSGVLVCCFFFLTSCLFKKEKRFKKKNKFDLGENTTDKASSGTWCILGTERCGAFLTTCCFDL